MRLKHLALGLVVATALPAAAVTTQAEEGIYVPLFTYRTGPFAGSGIPIAVCCNAFFSQAASPPSSRDKR